MRAIRPAIVLCAAGLAALPAAHAADIVVGQVAPLKNPASVANQMRAGIELYFDVVNRAGSLGPDRLKLATKDRADASDSAARTRELLREARPVALIGMQGTGPMEALVKEGVFAEAAVPVVGIRTGAASLHTPANPWLFHTRAGYGAEMGKIVEHLRTIGLRRFAILHENTPFGGEGRGHAEAALAAAGLAPLAVVGYDRGSAAQIAAAVGAVARAEPHAVLSAGDSTDVAEFHQALKRSGSRAQVVTLSTVDAAAVVKQVGVPHAHGLAIAQVVPDPLSTKSAIAREFQTNARKLRPRDFALTSAGLEGYIAAKVLVEGLRRCAPNPKPAQLRAALENLGRIDLGGVPIEFSPSRHSGSMWVDIGIIGPQGRLLQ